MENKNITLLILLATLLMGCQQTMTTSAYKHFVLNEENGLLKSKQLGDLKLDVLCKPAAYSALLEMEEGDARNQFDDRKMEYANSIDFNLRIGPNGGNKNILAYKTSSRSEIDHRITYFSFEFNNDIKLIQNGQVFSPTLFHFERSYDLTPYKTFVLSFPKLADAKDYTLVIDSDELGLHQVQFKFEKNKIVESPNLIF